MSVFPHLLHPANNCIKTGIISIKLPAETRQDILKRARDFTECMKTRYWCAVNAGGILFFPQENRSFTPKRGLPTNQSAANPVGTPARPGRVRGEVRARCTRLCVPNVGQQPLSPSARFPTAPYTARSVLRRNIELCDIWRPGISRALIFIHKVACDDK